MGTLAPFLGSHTSMGVTSHSLFQSTRRDGAKIGTGIRDEIAVLWLVG
jgi:hypothetical protein